MAADIQGLKPAAYHEAKDWLLATPRDELPSAVDELVHGDGDPLSSAMQKTTLEHAGTTEPPAERDEFEGFTAVSGSLVLDLGAPIRPTEVTAESPVSTLVRIVETDKAVKDAPYLLPLSRPSGPSVVVLTIPSSRTKPKGYIEALDALREFVSASLPNGTVALSPGRDEELAAALEQHQSPSPQGDKPPLALPSVKQLGDAQLQAAKKLILPIAVALLCSVPGLGEDLEEDEEVDKIVIADSLHKLVALWPDGNPPRAALKRVNEFLMSERRR